MSFQPLLLSWNGEYEAMPAQPALSLSCKVTFMNLKRSVLQRTLSGGRAHQRKIPGGLNRGAALAPEFDAALRLRRIACRSQHGSDQRIVVDRFGKMLLESGLTRASAIFRPGESGQRNRGNVAHRDG